MKEILNKIFKNSQKETDSFIILNLHSDKTAYHNKIKINNTNISTIKTSYHELFFDYFPYKIQDAIFSDLLPPRTFFGSAAAPMYLLILNSQKETQEFCPYIHFIKNLKFWGTLKQKKDKSVYLQSDDDFFIKLISNSLYNDAIEKIDDFNINIISKDEYEKKEVFDIAENDLNQKYEFKIKDLFFIQSNDEEYVNKVWFLEIESPELEEFRYKYHLFPKINGYNFSLPLGFIKYFKLRKSFPKMKINVTFFAA